MTKTHTNKAQIKGRCDTVYLNPSIWEAQIMDDYKCKANLVYIVRAPFKTIQKQKAKQTPKIRRQKYVIKDF